MADPFLSEIRMMSFSFPPKGWALCNGQLLPINQNQALFALLGTMFGGNGQINFALPDFRGRVPIHMGAGHVIGERWGEQRVSLHVGQMPTHSHALQASTSQASSDTPSSNEVLGAGAAIYGPVESLVALDASALGQAGSSEPHQNMQPYLTLSFCIALQGIFPTQN